MSKKSKLFFNVVLLILGFSSCKTYNVVAPKEEVNIHPIKQDNSTLNIPIKISNDKLAQLIKAGVPNPIKDEDVTPTPQLDVLEPVNQLITVTEQKTVQQPCEKAVQVAKKIPLIGNVLSTVMEHTVCDVIQTVLTQVNKVVIQTANIAVPVHYKLVLNDVHFDGNNDELHCHVVLDCAVQTSIDAKVVKGELVSCGCGGEPMAQIELTLVSKLTFSNDGKLVLSDKDWELKWNKPCLITALKIPVEDIINLPFVKKLFERKMDDLVQNKIPNDIDLNSKLEKNWPQISKPIIFPQIGILDLNISQLDAVNLFVTNTEINTGIGAVCKPLLNVTTDVETSTITPPFPGISNKQLQEGFNINILGTVKLKSLNQLASSIFSKYQEKINNKVLKITGVTTYQSDDKLVVEVDLSKPFRGKIYLWGKPQFNTNDNTVSIDSLEYTAESKSIIGKLANWMIQTEIVEKIVNEKLRYKYDKEISKAIAKVNKISQPLGNGIVLNGGCDVIKPTSIVVSDNALNIVTNVGGNAEVDIQ